MSEAKMISPMLDNFIMGGAMSDHHGVRCYPAIENGTEDKHIVKVISVPATSSQMDALILTGAYADREAALGYFKEITDGVVQEVDILEKLSELEGFLPFKACQVEPMESGEGYDIYLLSSYKRTLQKHFTRHSFTHLDALNLGLDLCSALSVCRRNGYLYIDLKPSNVYVTDQRLFRIGDLGFIRLDALKYASVPEKYMSVYTPPEVRDAFSALNATMDIYAAGLILYQTYNNGELPFNDEIQPGDKLPAPLYADYEMSEIILKACAANPEDRWQDPMEMGQAIVSYMQRNGAMDTPIVPMPEPVAEEVPEEIPEEETVSDISAEESPAQEALPEQVVVTDETPAEIPAETAASENLESPAETIEETVIELSDAQEEAEETECADETASAENSEALDFVEPEDFVDEEEEEILSDEADYEALTEETSEILNQADELAAMDVPEPVVIPEHVEVPVPELVIEEDDTAEDMSEEAEEDAPQIIEIDTEASITQEDVLQQTTEEPVKKSHWIRNAILLIVLLGLLVCGFFFYKQYYLLPIEIVSVEGNMDTLTVYVDTEIDEAKLKVICSDTYGNKIPATVKNGKAEFEGLVPNTAYSIKVVASGFHRLTGTASTAYSTPIQTNIVQFDAITGATEDSVIVSFTVEGPNCKEWTIVYSADGEEERTATFTSHMVTLSNLTVGKDYKMRLVPSEDLFITGQNEIVFTARKLVKAEKLQVISCLNNTLTVQWDAPTGETVSSWSVHCFNDTYNQTVITSDTTASFKDLDHTAEYTIEVKAVGMSVSETARVNANSVTASNFSTEVSDPTKIMFTWEASQAIPEDGWLLQYKIAGIDNEITIPCNSNSATIYPVVPNATYYVYLQDIKGNILLGSQTEIVTKGPVDFEKQFGSFTGKREHMEFTICRTPKMPGWGRFDLSASDYTSDFKAGENASYLVKFNGLHNEPDEEVIISYVVRNTEGTPLHYGVQSNTWKAMWPTTYCKLNVPAIPSTEGTYTIEVYFNGMLANEQTITISK